MRASNLWIEVTQERSLHEIHEYILLESGLKPGEYYLLSNGKIINNGIPSNQKIHIVPRIIGGKGGFGSMLRAIGAQIEKTTNREACRDLSGRRLRDINEEKRLKNWISQQAEREKEAKERKQKKLEKLCEQPKFEFKDEEYDKERQALPERVEDAVLKGLEASASGSSSSAKRKIVEKPAAKKKRKLWVDSELDEDLSSSDEGSDVEEVQKKPESDVEEITKKSVRSPLPELTERENIGESSANLGNDDSIDNKCGKIVETKKLEAVSDKEAKKCS